MQRRDGRHKVGKYWVAIVALLLLNAFWFGQWYSATQDAGRWARELRELDRWVQNLDRQYDRQVMFNREYLFSKGQKKRADMEWPLPKKKKTQKQIANAKQP